MASISSDKHGNRTIQFVARDKQRRTLRLSKVSMRQAVNIKAHVEALNMREDHGTER